MMMKLVRRKSLMPGNGANVG